MKTQAYKMPSKTTARDHANIAFINIKNAWTIKEKENRFEIVSKKGVVLCVYGF